MHFSFKNYKKDFLYIVQYITCYQVQRRIAFYWQSVDEKMQGAPGLMYEVEYHLKGSWLRENTKSPAWIKCFENIVSTKSNGVCQRWAQGEVWVSLILTPQYNNLNGLCRGYPFKNCLIPHQNGFDPYHKKIQN